MGKTFYQGIRTQVKKNLRRVTERTGMEYAIRATTPLSVPEAQRELTASLRELDFHVIHETDVQAVHNHYKLDYPEYRILKVVRAEQFMECPMASTAVRLDHDTGAILPPGVVLYELDGLTHVSAVRPSTLLAVFRNPELRDVIVELESYLWDALDGGIPESTMISEEPPLRPDEPSRRRQFKELLNLVVSLVDAEFTIHVSTETPAEEVTRSVQDALRHRGQHLLGEVEGTGISLVVNPGQAHKALAIDPDVGVFAPLSVSVSSEIESGRTHVRAVRPSTLLIFFGHPAMQDILLEMEMLLWNGIVAGTPNGRIESRQPPLQPEGGQRTTAGGLPGGLGALRPSHQSSQ